MRRRWARYWKYARALNNAVPVRRRDDRTGSLVALRMTPLRICKMQLLRPSASEREWLRDRLADTRDISLVTWTWPATVH
jgi:hypothetical protein